MVPVPYSEMSPQQKLRAYWRDFCDADPTPPEFVDEMEAAGLVRWRNVTKRDVESDPFAAERGIEIGGSIWVLTEAGRLALAQEDEKR